MILLSDCCGAPAIAEGFCGQCRDASGFERYCEDCGDTVVNCTCFCSCKPVEWGGLELDKLCPTHGKE